MLFEPLVKITTLVPPEDRRVVEVILPVNEATLLELQEYVGQRLAALTIEDLPIFKALFDERPTTAAMSAAIAAAVAGILAGAGPAYDTLRELQDLIVGDETALAALSALVAQKVNQTAFDATVAAVRDEAFIDALLFG